MSEEDFEAQIDRWKELHGDKKFYISGGWTTYDKGKPEHTPMKIVKGILKRPRCRICNENLDKLRKDNPERRLINYCSSDCYQEFKELYKIKKKLNAVMMTWSPSKPPIDKRTIRYCLEQGGQWYTYKARKTKRV